MNGAFIGWTPNQEVRHEPTNRTSAWRVILVLLTRNLKRIWIPTRGFLAVHHAPLPAASRPLPPSGPTPWPLPRTTGPQGPSLAPRSDSSRADCQEIGEVVSRARG